MININIPGMGELNLQHLVLDYNGTIAFDGSLIQGVEEKLNQLADALNIYIVTADTFGTVRQKCRNIKGKMKVLSSSNGALEKEQFVESLGTEKVVAVGNGVNDSLMLKKAALGIIVIGEEGAASLALNNADIIVKDIHDALDLLLNKTRIKATLRS
ncbi:MAG: HAD family hydrolase [Thermacetogeniaceae bacterium]|nr:HAD family hydrolase [Syntrophomonadaceae bacterium]HAF17073.1 ATPase P [Peptococcaceae bacterium]